jgi:hypothetical protein
MGWVGAKALRALWSMMKGFLQWIIIPGGTFCGDFPHNIDCLGFQTVKMI